MNCERIRPVWEELQREHGDELDLIVIDRDTAEGRDFAESHNIYYQPGFVAYDVDGNLVYEGLGPYDPDEVTELVFSVIPGG